MRKSITALAAALLLAGIFPQAAVAAETVSYTVPDSRVEMSASGEGSFSITVDRPAEPYAAAQFELLMPDGVSIRSVRYSVDGASAGPAELTTEAGVFGFSVFSSNTSADDYTKRNVYSDALTCTVGIAYNPSVTILGARTITIRKVSLVSYDGAYSTSSIVSEDNALTVTVVPYGSGTGMLEPTPTPGTSPPSTTTPGGGSTPSTGTGETTPSGQGDGSGEGGEDGEEGAAGPSGLPTLSPALDRTSGKAYVFGYPDGTFKPEASITRAETASMIYSIVTDSAKSQFAQSAYRFSDIPEGEWYAEAVGYLAEAGIILGYPDGTFKGDDEISRAEFATIISKFEQLDSAGGMPFTDVDESHWAYEFILSCYINEWIAGYPDGTFQPDAMITRAEAVTIVNRAIGRDLSDYAGLDAKFTDVSPDEWYYEQIVAASNDRPS